MPGIALANGAFSILTTRKPRSSKQSFVTVWAFSVLAQSKPRYDLWAGAQHAPVSRRSFEIHDMRLFVSSPSDVAPERARVDAVAARLNGEFEGVAQIEVMRWETGFYTADRSFQEAIDEAVGHMHEADIVV